MDTPVAAVAEEGADTGITTRDRWITVSLKIVRLMPHEECRTCQAQGANYSTPTSAQNLNILLKDVSQITRPLVGVQLLEMSSSSSSSSNCNHGHQFDHQKDQMEVAEEDSGLLIEATGAVDYFYRHALLLPPTSNLSGQLHHRLVRRFILSNIANNFTICRKRQSI